MAAHKLFLTNRNALLVAVPVIIFVVLCFTLWRSAIVTQMNAWKLLPEPEHLTELYFTNPNTLPSSYVPNAPAKVDFTMHNLEYQTEVYRYRIIEENQTGSQSQILTSNTFTLKQNQYQSVSFTGPLVDMGPNARIVVSLPTVHESIDYLITRSRT